MAFDKEFNNIINRLAVENNIDSDIVEKIIKAQFRFVKDTIEQGELQSVHLHHLGKFACKPKRVQDLIEKGYKIKKHDN